MADDRENRLGLLEILTFKAGYLYLSDLHQPDRLLHIQHILRGISPDRYSLKEWEDAVEYITRQARSFETAEQAWQYLLNCAPSVSTNQ